MKAKQNIVSKAAAFVSNIPPLVAVLGGIAGIALAIVFIGNSFGWWDAREIEPVFPSRVIRGDQVNITGENLDLVSRVLLSDGRDKEPVFLMPDDKNHLTIVVPDGVVPGDYVLEFIRIGKDGGPNGLTSVVSPTPTPLPTPTPTPKPPSEENSELKFAGLSWKSAQLQNAIARTIIEEGYGRKTSVVFGPIPDLWESLFDGSVHVMMEVWLPDYERWWDQGLRDGSVIPLGKSLDENWQSSFVVTTYLVEENPGLKAVSDLPEFKHLFVTAASAPKGLLNGCVEDWVCSEINEAQLKAYELEDTIELIHPASEDRLFGSLQGAYDRRDPWLGFVWGPTKIAEDLDLTRLEEAPYSKICWDDDKGCAFPLSKVRIVVHPSLIAEAPDVMEFLRKWDLDTDTQISIEDRSASLTAGPSALPAFSTARAYRTTASKVSPSKVSPMKASVGSCPYRSSYRAWNLRLASLSGVPGAVP